MEKKMQTRQLNQSICSKKVRPIRILQFGEGNFLRAFADSFVQTLNDENEYNTNIAVVKPTNRGNLEKFNQQDCLYTVVIRGISNGRTIDETQTVDSIAEVFSPYEDYDKFLAYAHSEELELIISNTTEAGIVFDINDSLCSKPAASFPGKLTQFLYERFSFFCGSEEKGLILLPVELIDNNGDALKKCVLQYAELWGLPQTFTAWIESACTFCNTLVDRIVSGFPSDSADDIFEKLGYQDQLITVGEPFGLWVIEADEQVRGKILPGCGSLPILFTDDYRPFKQRKVRILNGAHTSFAMLAWLCGLDYVNESMRHPEIRAFIEQAIFREIIPCLTLPEEELTAFADAVFERFENPFMKHALLSISLNSVSKWKARCLPSLLDYITKFGTLPECLTFSLAALIVFYRNAFHQTSERTCNVTDDQNVLDFFASHALCSNEKLTQDYLSYEEFHGMNLAELPGITEKITFYLNTIDSCGIHQALSQLLSAINQEAIHE